MMDFVITWVDGGDAAHREKMRPYLCDDDAVRSDIAGPERLLQRGEIRWCVASVLRFAAGFVRKVFIVTDGQDPHLGDFLQKNFPESASKVEIVDHSVIFRGYEEYLPVFNSIAIETMLFRIPGLSDHFVYMNDDVILTAPVTEEDFIINGKTIAYTQRQSVLQGRLVHFFRPKVNGHKVLTFRDTLRTAATVLDKNHFQRTPHIAFCYRRAWFEEFFAQRPEVLVGNIGCRFRSPSQVNLAALYYTATVDSGESVVRSAVGKKFYMRSSWKERNYARRKLRELDSNPRLKVACFGALYKLSEEDFALYKAWLDRRLGVSD